MSSVGKLGRPSASTLKPHSARKSMKDQKNQPGGSGGSKVQIKTPNESKTNLCGKVITIPPELPDILKMYAKGAMRTQPPDLLRWSGAYFRAMANGETLPTKEKVEYPVRQSKDGLSPGILRVIDNQLGSQSGMQAETAIVFKRWRGFGLSVDSFNEILARAGMSSEAKMVDWDKLIAVMASTIGQNLTDTMAILCEILTSQPDGSEPRMKYSVWLSMYSFLGTQILRVVTTESFQAVDTCLSPIAKDNGGLIGPKDWTSAACRLE
ncbi:Ropporin-1-like protein [Folsomia candida]|uniref:Ropporin-1-like protein n=1 Tax=Folsomia candida TaxID=158441 RepID=A0A226EDI2_FOLCA|nr:Ropporin-1-like protein [Folsomia candida]